MKYRSPHIPFCREDLATKAWSLISLAVASALAALLLTIGVDR